MNKRDQKAKDILGMHPSTAKYRLTKDIIFCLLEYKRCYRCGDRMTRDTFSIEHKQDWLNSESPLAVFMDLNNIVFSHKACNLEAMLKGRRTTDKEKTEQRRKYQKEYRKKNPVIYDPEARKRHFKKTGH